MKKEKKNIAIFHNLPEGGGLRMVQHIIERYKGIYNIDVYSISDLVQKDLIGCKTYHQSVKPWRGFILRNLWIYFKLPAIHKVTADIINQKKYAHVLVTHDYFTKSPYLLRYIGTDNIYLCQEPQREFYEPWIIHAPTLKDKIVNVLRFPIKWIDEKNVACSGSLLCNSQYSQKVLKSVYKKDSNIIYPGVDEEFFKPEKIKKENIILCVGGINPVKNQLFLVSALCPLLKKYKLVLVGDGKREYINKVQVLCDNKNIEIIKKISDQSLKSLYNKALVTCITAYKEPFGLSSIESQACGTPVVSIEEGGPVETIINGETGYLSKAEKKEFEEKVRKVILNCKSMGSNARMNVIKKWTWNKTLAALDKYFG